MAGEDEEQPAKKTQPRRVQVAQQQITRPAQLSPEVIAKFEREDVQALVDSFSKSVEYQNQTDRLSMEKHYKYLNSSRTKRYAFSVTVFAGALYAAIHGQWGWIPIVTLVSICLVIIEAPDLFEQLNKFVAIIKTKSSGKS